MTFFVFSAFDASHGNELWGSDGTVAGTRLIKDIHPGWGWSSAHDFTDLGNGYTLFAADDGLSGSELWITDGTPEGTVLLKDLNPGSTYNGYTQVPRDSAPHDFTSIGDGKFVFAAYVGNSAGNTWGCDGLWITDGTSDGTVLVSSFTANLADYPTGSSPSWCPRNMIAFGDGRALFTANLVQDENDRVLHNELWITDGTAAGTIRVADINNCYSLVRLPNGKVIFSSQDADMAVSVWVTDGTAAGTMLLHEPISSVAGYEFDFALLNDGRAVFTQRGDANSGTWVSDGTVDGTHLLSDMPSELAPAEPTDVGGIWVTEQGADGVTHLVHLFSDATDCVTLQDGRTLFSANYSLWVTDGTRSGTMQVFDGPAREIFADLGDGRVAFHGLDAVNGWQPRITDGTPEGTYLLKDRLAGVGVKDFSDCTEDLSVNLANGTADGQAGGAFAHQTLALIDIIKGGSGNDSIVGNWHDNDISGGAGDDYLVGGGGLDNISGGAGNDFIYNYVEDFDPPFRTVQIQSFLQGDEGDDWLVCYDRGAGVILDGGTGNDTFCTRPTITLFGGDGFDRLFGRPSASDTWSIDLGATSIEWMYAGQGDDVIDATSQTEGVEVYGNAGYNRITGSAFSDQLWGGYLADVLIGGGGDDTLVGGTSGDSLSGGAGNDRLFVDGDDKLIDGGDGYDVVYIMQGSKSTNWVYVGTPESFENGGNGFVIVSQTNGADISLDLHASAVEWVADLADGDDTLDGSQLEVDMTAFAGGGVDLVMGGAGNDFLWGEAGDDVIAGGAGDDTLVGGSGGDVLDGGSGTDAIYLGSGDGALDRVVFETGSGTDFVFDFVRGEDKLDLSALGTSFGALTITDWDGHAHVQVGAGPDLIVVANMGGQLTSEDFAF